MASTTTLYIAKYENGPSAECDIIGASFVRSNMETLIDDVIKHASQHPGIDSNHNRVARWNYSIHELEFSNEEVIALASTLKI